MKKLMNILLTATFCFGLLAGCESQQEKEERAAREQFKRIIGDVDKDLERFKRERAKPVKPWYER